MNTGPEWDKKVIDVSNLKNSIMNIIEDSRIPEDTIIFVDSNYKEVGRIIGLKELLDWRWIFRKGQTKE